jgi:hypothetical protein
MIMSRISTGNYKAVARKTVRDRWVWLALGVFILVGSLFVAVTANAAMFEPATETVVASTDPLIEMIKTSGPAGGIVLILGWFIRTWQADVKSAAAKTETAIEKLRERIEAAHTSDSLFSGQLAVIRAEQAAIVHRLDRLERRSSGSHRKADE